jgi:hypothetical protein
LTINIIDGIIKEREARAQKFGGPDPRHQKVIETWGNVKKSMTREDVMPAGGFLVAPKLILGAIAGLAAIFGISIGTRLSGVSSRESSGVSVRVSSIDSKCQ